MQHSARRPMNPSIARVRSVCFIAFLSPAVEPEIFATGSVSFRIRLISDTFVL